MVEFLPNKGKAWVWSLVPLNKWVGQFLCYLLTKLLLIAAGLEIGLGYTVSSRPRLSQKTPQNSHTVFHRLPPLAKRISQGSTALYLSWCRVHQCCCRTEWVWLQSCFHQMKSRLPQGGPRTGLQTGPKSLWCTALQATELCCLHGLSVLNLIWNKGTTWAANIIFQHCTANSLTFSLYAFWIFILLIKIYNTKRCFKRIFHSQSHPYNCFFISPCRPTYCLHCSSWLNTYSFLAMIDKCKGVLQDKKKRHQFRLFTAGGGKNPR